MIVSRSDLVPLPCIFHLLLISPHQTPLPPDTSSNGLQGLPARVASNNRSQSPSRYNCCAAVGCGCSGFGLGGIGNGPAGVGAGFTGDGGECFGFLISVGTDSAPHIHSDNVCKKQGGSLWARQPPDTISQYNRKAPLAPPLATPQRIRTGIH